MLRIVGDEVSGQGACGLTLARGGQPPRAPASGESPQGGVLLPSFPRAGGGDRRARDGLCLSQSLEGGLRCRRCAGNVTYLPRSAPVSLHKAPTSGRMLSTAAEDVA